MVTETRTNLDGTAYVEPTVDANITVRFAVSENQDLGELAYRLTATVTSATNIDDNVFVFEHIPPTPGRTRNTYRFVTVATPIDMADLPIAIATPESAYRCRNSVLTLYYPTASKAEAGRDAILRRINALCENTEALARITDSIDVTWAFDTDDEDSTSEAGSSVPG